MTDTFTPYDPAGLPALVVDYLDARDAGDHAKAHAVFTPDATVVDDGTSHHGSGAIRSWIERSTNEFAYTSTRLAQQVEIADRPVVRIRVDGDFPGGTVTLHQRFAVSAGQVTGLVIEA